MMMEEVIELNDRTRLVVQADPVPLNPRYPDLCITGCYTPPRGWAREEGPLPLHAFPGDIAEAHEMFGDLGWLEPDRLMRRWAWIFHGLELQEHAGTYWFCDETTFAQLHGGEFTREAQREVIASEREDYRRYIDKETKIVSLQRLARFRRTTKKYHEHHQDLLEVWETIDSISDMYLEPSHTVGDVAFEAFYTHFTKKELTIITAMLDEQRG